VLIFSIFTLLEITL